ncbi:MAG: excinuclease ABC subunit UvrC [Lachnospiraceae bacterium]|nr:excinuclease ABC subunit UvrC [Lachnospiraceae bacterium]
MEFDIEENLKKLPKKPGVYIMHAENDEIIYVGKAVNLFNRVHSYFRATKKSAKIEKMVTHINYFEYIVTDSELEALVLECNLIKEHRPQYNTMLRDDKSYPYIKVTVNEEYPRILFARKPHGDTGASKTKARLYGPYTSSYSVRETIELINKIYQLRTCNRVLPRDTDKERPCLNYQIHQCQAPCRSGCTNAEKYNEGVRGALDFLEGNYKPILNMLEENMLKASEELRFEDAAGYRDLLNSVKDVAQKQKITSSDGADRDVIAMARNEKNAVVAIFFVRDGRIIGRDHFYMTETAGTGDADILGSFLKQFYTGTPFIPPQIMIEKEIEDREVAEEWLSDKRGSKVSILIPRRGIKEKLVELAKKNAEIVLTTDSEKLEREEIRTTRAAQGIADLIGLDNAVRIESYDISNISGFESVGSMVVFENGRPRRSDYRKFRIKTVVGPDDYASMNEVLTRRFTRLKNAESVEGAEKTEDSFTRYPDLILMDGGRGQVNIALEVLEKLGLDIPVAGMVKDDRHRTRGIYYNNVEQPIDTHSESFHLITRIQDETHRFAITYHRNLRSNAQIHSILDDIQGIGDKRRKALMKEFGSIEAVAEATDEELAAAPGMNARAAKAVRDFFEARKKGNIMRDETPYEPASEPGEDS